MPVSKVNYGQTTLIDLTQDTVDATNLLQGETAHNSAGDLVTGLAAKPVVNLHTMSELATNWNPRRGFIIFYVNVETGTMYITNTLLTNTGALSQTSNIESASTWYLEQVSGYTDRFYLYTKINDENQYIYNNTGAGANFIGLSTSQKDTFIFTQQNEDKFYLQKAGQSKYLQHSGSGKGIRYYTDNKNADNCQMTFTYNSIAIVPSGTLTITENGTYDVYGCSTVIVNV